MKQSIKWHNECLANLEDALNRQRTRVKIETEYLNSMEERLKLMQKQIDEATKRKMDGFDVERFLVKRKAKVELKKIRACDLAGMWCNFLDGVTGSFLVSGFADNCINTPVGYMMLYKCNKFKFSKDQTEDASAWKTIEQLEGELK